MGMPLHTTDNPMFGHACLLTWGYDLLPDSRDAVFSLVLCLVRRHLVSFALVARRIAGNSVTCPSELQGVKQGCPMSFTCQSIAAMFVRANSFGSRQH